MVLAKPSSATDQDYERVQGVVGPEYSNPKPKPTPTPNPNPNQVGHEYFHNWSGNRVTVRDWFQLSLKEGLTNFRQQGFEEDMTSAAVRRIEERLDPTPNPNPNPTPNQVRRIEEVRVIRSAQFPQDAGPMAHSVRPESYSAIDNFYTVTVYNKGAEVTLTL